MVLRACVVIAALAGSAGAEPCHVVSGYADPSLFIAVTGEGVLARLAAGIHLRQCQPDGSHFLDGHLGASFHFANIPLTGASGSIGLEGEIGMPLAQGMRGGVRLGFESDRAVDARLFTAGVRLRAYDVLVVGVDYFHAPAHDGVMVGFGLEGWPGWAVGGLEVLSVAVLSAALSRTH
jgi:hypothetical protein